MKHFVQTLICLFAFCSITCGKEPDGPDGTYLYCKRDNCDLYMDIYSPTGASGSKASAASKPTIVYIPAGESECVSRYSEEIAEWSRLLNANGFRVISIDCRPGLEDNCRTVRPQADQFEKALGLALEDLFTAVNFIIDNAEQLETGSADIVVCGSSAGAVAAMQAEYEICNRTYRASELPEGFRFSGIMSFAGAVLPRDGNLKYADSPAPTLIMHGTEDDMVPYNQRKSGGSILYGSGKIVKNFQKSGFIYNMYHFKGSGHEIAGALSETVDIQLNFLNNNIVQKRPQIIDAWVTDPSLTNGRQRLPL